ncbi:MAG: hypothetical protein J2P49_04265, partial [Methylocapsa sp.]|nr:hypothetical protein [Methylocapsa sp.]
MNSKHISLVSGAALLALTGAASAGPMNVASPRTVTPKPIVEQVYYRHYRHYGWHRHGYYRRYGYWNPGAAVAGAALGLATLPFAAAAANPYYYRY